MKILILADPSSSHTIKWANSLHQNGIEVFLFGLSHYDPSQFHKDLRIESLKTPNRIKSKLNGNFLKAIYLTALPNLKRIIKDFKPDLLHAHYAASYGFLGALSGFNPFLLSVWGIDILTFPYNSFIHRGLIKFTLKKADRIFATSRYLANETNKFTNKHIEVIPFGIDTGVFKPNTSSNQSNSDEIVIGTVKQMEIKYGIEYLIRAFSIIKRKYPDRKLKFLLVGGGSLEVKFQRMINDLELKDSCSITGQIPYNKIVDYHNQLSIAAYISTVESFGVSVLESSACEIPVIVSDIGGLPEVVENEVTGLIVKPRDVDSTVCSLEKLILDKNLRKKFGIAGRERVKQLFEWDNTLSNMIKIYEEILDKNK